MSMEFDELTKARENPNEDMQSRSCVVTTFWLRWKDASKNVFY